MQRMKNRGKKCSVGGCEVEAFCKGMCRKHSTRLRMRKWRNGTTELMRRENGTGNINRGYVILTTASGERKGEHIILAEKALGRPLPKGAVVHHVDRNRANNIGTNLVVCPSQAYHLLLHKRARDLGYE